MLDFNRNAKFFFPSRFNKIPRQVKLSGYLFDIPSPIR